MTRPGPDDPVPESHPEGPVKPLEGAATEGCRLPGNQKPVPGQKLPE